MLDRYLFPIGPYVLMASGFGICLYMFLCLKREIQGLKARIRERGAQADAANREMLAQIEEMRSDLRQAEDNCALFVPPKPPVSGMNLNKRTQVLRMFRRGDHPDQIATSLNLPRNEVELLVKVYKIAVNGNPAAR